jgi:hypothetical protein
MIFNPKNINFIFWLYMHQIRIRVSFIYLFFGYIGIKLYFETKLKKYNSFPQMQKNKNQSLKFLFFGYIHVFVMKFHLK